MKNDESPSSTSSSLGAIIPLLLCACARGVERPPNVVLIVVDTLRTDRLPFHGSPRNTAPFLNELAERSLVFENAWSPSSWTLPAAVSILTSVHPFQHGVNNLIGLELEPGQEPVPVARIPAEVETMAEALSAAGYRTFGVVSNVLVGDAVGFDRGFGRFVQLQDEDAEAVNAVVAGWRDQMLQAEPFFLYLHYIDPHDTYHARAPWFDLQASAEGWPEISTKDIRLDWLDWFMTRIDPLPEEFEGRKARELAPDEIHDLMVWAKAAYDSEIAYLDAHIRQVFELLRLEEAVVVCLADHGEEFWEHGELTHEQNLYCETLRVPLLLHMPQVGGPRGRAQAHVSTLDVLPTLRRLLGLSPSHQDQGQDLLGDGDRRPVYALLESKSGQHELDRDLRSIVFGGRKVIALEGGRPELYDLAADPLERVDLAEQHPEIVAEMLRLLEETERAAPRYPRTTRLPQPPSEALLEHLRGIGYAGDD